MPDVTLTADALQVREDDPLFQNKIANVVSPNGKTVFQAKLTQPIRSMEVELTAGALFGAQRDNISIAEAKKFRDVTPHHHAPERRG
jgi:hypothetical protein